MLIYKYNISDITEVELNNWYYSMNKERQEDIARIINKEKRALKIAADRLCRKAIYEFCGASSENIEFCKNEYGKPYVKNLPVHFSISHSGSMAVCAVSNNEIGIDIEKIRPIRIKAAEKFASPEELRYIKSNQNGFFEIWTLKEAYFKCIGTGLGADIKDVSFNVTNDKIICSEIGYKLSFYEAADGYVCSVCQKVTD